MRFSLSSLAMAERVTTCCGSMFWQTASMVNPSPGGTVPPPKSSSVVQAAGKSMEATGRK